MKVDLKREIASYRARRGVFDVVDVPPLQYLMVDGKGDPNTAAAYADALAALYPVSYALKFLSKKAGRDYVVMPLEALWWAPDMASFTTERDKSRWHWSAMIGVPDWLGAEDVEAAREGARAKASPAIDLLRLERLEEGLSVQTLHVGSYDDEAPVLEQMHEQVIPERGLRMTGRHHEIYLGDPRRVEPSRLRTILRQPVERV